MAEIDEGAISAAVDARVSKVLGMIGTPGKALQLALNDPPDRTKDDSVKAKNANAIIKILVSVPKSKPKQLVGMFNPDQADVCMKHVYKGMEKQENTDVLLAWHAALYAKFGIGCVVRAINERRTPVPVSL